MAPPVTIKEAIANILEDLTEPNLEKFKERLLDRKQVRRARVDRKSFLVVADVMVSTYTEAGALPVAVDILTQIDCNEEAKTLRKETEGLSSTPGSGGNKHFVDKHRVQLIQRVGHIETILDELLDEGVIQQELYDKIRSLSIPQEKMRELYSTGLKASEACKDVFYKILKKHDPYLIRELEGK
ncbi:apoptosis-associated speck-like protein containing a CARD [Solea solea]|uniref:apoptosis-associated speck-like protein containing a CARD n=1 Tax=Solea solea TaxID=90069 RepID=UPI00272D822B|nr:apoptosis-associated speck-like protein containing a CARD [Solea solea]